MAEKIDPVAPAAEEATSAPAPEPEAALPSADAERSDTPPEAEAPAQGSTGGDAEPEPSPLVARWLERRDIFNSGIPNRDITEADALAPDLLELAVESGTHERIG